MKVREMLELIDSAKENQASEGAKITWLNDVEGKVACEIFKKAPQELVGLEGEESELSVPDAYSGVYLLYVLAMIELSKGHYDDYVKIRGCFDNEFKTYAKQVIRSR
jgi:hypothetical protein